MANTYTQLYVQFVFAVKGRQSLLRKQYRQEVYKYVTGIVEKRGHKMLQINGMSDHVHIFIGFKPTEKLSDLVRDIKTNSSMFIKEQRFTPFKFEWQAGYGAFTYGHSQIDDVCKYIANQEEHHKKVTFRQEWTAFMNKFEVENDEQYWFDFLEDFSDWGD
jgi:REP element-mobilizing transposase RayT